MLDVSIMDVINIPEPKSTDSVAVGSGEGVKGSSPSTVVVGMISSTDTSLLPVTWADAAPTRTTHSHSSTLHSITFHFPNTYAENRKCPNFKQQKKNNADFEVPR